MKILQITSRADTGGGPKHLYDLMNCIKDDVDLFVACPNVGQFNLKYKNISKGYFELPHRKFNFSTLVKLFFWIKKNKIDLIHSHGKGAGIYSRILGITGMKVVHTFHGVHYNKSLKCKFNLFVEKMLKPFSDFYIFCSFDEENEALKNGINYKNSSVVLNGINLSCFKNERELKRELKSLGTIARPDPIKGFNHFFENIRELKKVSPEFKIIIAGCNFENFNDIDDLKEAITFLGDLENPMDFYSKIDLLVSHSIREGLPLTVLEAMAQGIPCLLSKTSGHNYFIEKECAIGFILNDFNSFKSGLEKLKSEKVRAELISKSLELIKNHHSVEVMSDKITKIYFQFK